MAMMKISASFPPWDGCPCEKRNYGQLRGPNAKYQKIEGPFGPSLYKEVKYCYIICY